MKNKLDPILAAGIDNQAAPGVVAIAADRDGIIYEGAAGVMGPENNQAVGTDSVFRIASMTKAITGACVMQLVERGELDLDAPAKSVAPEIGEAVVLTGFDDKGTPQTRPPKGDVTLRHLLTHTSGYAYDMFNSQAGQYMEHAGLPSILTCKYESLRAPLIFDPGSNWEYGIGIDWAGRMVEIVSGKTLGEFFDENLGGPLGMGDTSFVLRDDMASRLVGAATRTPDGGIAPLDFEFEADGDFHMGGGGFYSTANDYMRFTRMLLGGGELDGVRVLNEATVKHMGENSIGDIEVPDLISDNPALALSGPIFPGQIARWGLSFALNTEDVPGGRGAWSLTWAGVHNTFYWVDAKNGIATVLMMQLLPANDPKVLEVLVGYEQALYAALG